MLSITPCRERISERFPLASFVVKVPADRYFEVACATDPRLFAAEHREHRTPANFATSRLGGLLRAPAGQATYMMPPDQLRRFAGSRRLFYALAAYRGPQGHDPIFTLSHDRLDQVPSIQISPDFTGKSLDRGRLVQQPAEQRYGGGTAAPIGWGGDAVVAATARVGGAAPTAGPPLAADSYDDGFDVELWRSGPGPAKRDDDDDDDERDDDAKTDTVRVERDEPDGFEDGAELARKLGGLPAAAAPPAARRRGGPPVAAARPTAQRLGGRPAAAPRPPAPARGAARTPAAPARSIRPPAPPAVPPPPAVERVERSTRPATPPATARPAPRTTPGAPATLGGSAPSTWRPRPAPGAARATPLAPSRSTRAPSPEIDVGFEDAPDLSRNLGPRPGASRVRFGEARRPAIARGLGKFPDFAMSEPDETELPAERPGEVITPDVFDPTDARQRLRILHRVGTLESGGDGYRAVNADLEYENPDLPTFYHRKHVGLSWGFIQFAQRYGSLGEVLAACNDRDPDAFRTTFGEHNAADPDVDPQTLPERHLLRVTNAPTEEARLEPVTPPDGSDAAVLWAPVWTSVFEAAGGVSAFKAAQREVADRRYYEPYLDFLACIGFDSVRAQAMFVDRSIHMGGGAAIEWVMSVVGPIRSKGDLTAALDRLGFDSVRAFQQSPPPGLPGSLAVDGVFGWRTHAAMMWALRQLADPERRMPTLDEMLAAVCEEAGRRAEGTRIWEIIAARLRQLKNDRALDRLPPEPNDDGVVEQPSDEPSEEPAQP